MASFNAPLKSSIAPFSVSQSQYSPSRWSFFCSEFSFTGRRTFGSGNRKLRSRILFRRFRISSSSTNKETQNQSNGEEPPESLFMKELKKRGITPTSLLEESKKPSNTGEETKYREEDGGFSQRKAVSMDAEQINLRNQLEQSRALNSEGLEGLIPRAKLLLTLGGTFFLAFWPLILVTVAFFSALYLYFGTSFIHDGRDSRIAPPEYIDPYELLEEERISRPAPRLY